MQAARILVLLLTFLLPSLTAADQSDPRLDSLFERLQEIEDERRAAEVTRRIWQIWRSTEDPMTAEIMERGARALASNRLARAERYFDQVVNMAPRYAEGWNQRATVRYLRGKFVQSALDIRRTLVLEPRHFGALAGLGLVYIELGREQAAIESFRRALAINPHLAGARQNLEMLQRQQRGGDA